MGEQNSQDNQGGTDQEIYRGKLITVRVRTVRKPDGGESRYEIVEHSGAMAIVAVRYESHDSGEPLVALVYSKVRYGAISLPLRSHMGPRGSSMGRYGNVGTDKMRAESCPGGSRRGHLLADQETKPFACRSQQGEVAFGF